MSESMAARLAALEARVEEHIQVSRKEADERELLEADRKRGLDGFEKYVLGRLLLIEAELGISAPADSAAEEYAAPAPLAHGSDQSAPPWVSGVKEMLERIESKMGPTVTMTLAQRLLPRDPAGDEAVDFDPPGTVLEGRVEQKTDIAGELAEPVNAPKRRGAPRGPRPKKPAARRRRA